MQQSRRILATILTALLSFFGILALPAAAQAAVIPNDGTYGILNPRVDRQEYQSWMSVQVSVDFRVPNSSTAGDTMEFQLPSPLDVQTFAPFDITDDAGVVIARASIDATGLVTLTFTDYVDSHDDVAGSARFWVQFDDHIIPEGEEQATVDLFGAEVVVIGNTPTPGDEEPTKYGWFAGSQAEATARNADGSLVDVDGPHIYWAVLLHSGSWTRVDIVDTLDPDLVFCEGGTVAPSLPWGLEARDSVEGNSWGDIDVPAGVTSTVACNADGTFTFSIDKPAELTNVQLRVVYGTKFRTNGAGQPVHGADNTVGFKPAYDNASTATYDGVLGEENASQLISLEASGEGSGVPGPAIDIEKYSGTWSGVVFVDGVAQTSGAPDFEPLVLPEGDFDAAPGAQLDPVAATPLTFTVTNIGIEALTQIVVRDDAVGGALAALSCDATAFGGTVVEAVDGAVSLGGVTLPRGASFSCSATLPALGSSAVHANVASVTAVGASTSIAVADEDAWHASTPAAPATPTPTPTPSVVQPTVSPGSPASGEAATPRGTLPRTGTEIAWGTGALAALALVLGGGLLLRRRRG